MDPSESLQLVNILQTMGDAFVTLDKNWRFSFVNDRSLLMMGKTTDELIGTPMWEAFPQIVGTIFDKEYHRAMEQKVPVRFETHYPSSNVWMEIRAYPHDNGLAIFYTDISEQKYAEQKTRSFTEKLEQTVKKRTAELEKALKELEDFSYTVSHDLRTPIRAIHGWMSILLEDHEAELSAEIKKYILNARNNSKKMGELIDGVLEFIQLGRTKMNVTKVPMRELAYDVWEDLKQEEGDRDIRFTIKSIPPAVADKQKMQDVWRHLISNALKYTRQKEKAVIEIGAAENEGHTTYYISDNGVGFDPRYTHKLFGVFQRLHNNASFEGTGVGLAITNRIITRHGGKIWADSSLKGGSTFYFSLTWDGE